MPHDRELEAGIFSDPIHAYLMREIQRAREELSVVEERLRGAEDLIHGNERKDIVGLRRRVEMLEKLLRSLDERYEEMEHRQEIRDVRTKGIVLGLTFNGLGVLANILLQVFS